MVYAWSASVAIFSEFCVEYLLLSFRLNCLKSQQRSGSHTVADAVRTELFAVAAGAVNLVIGRVVQIGRVQRTMALCAVEAAAMPHLHIIIR